MSAAVGILRLLRSAGASAALRRPLATAASGSGKQPIDTPASVFEETHTGQRYEPGDYRLARFVGKQKLINRQQAIDLVHEVPPIACAERVAHCDGGDDALGHPRVYINLDGPGHHSCGYCGLRFYHKQDGGHHH